VLEAVGRQRGALLGKGKVNTQKAAEIVITDFRSQRSGPHHAGNARGTQG
jgi:ribosome biogenesis GTPase A